MPNVLTRVVTHVRPFNLPAYIAYKGSLIDELYKAINGQYHVILDLMSVIQTGPACKRLLDEIINRCDAVVNLREAILMHRVEHSVHGDFSSIEKGIGCLERYFSLLAFTSYVNEALSAAIYDKVHDHKMVFI